MQIADRVSLWGGKRLPFDAKVEYLESTGTQYINTGINFMPTVVSPVPWGCQNFSEVSGYARYFTTSGLPGFRRDAGVSLTIELNGVSKQFIINGVVSPSSSSFFKTAASGDCWLFGRSDTGALGSLRIYSAQFIDENGVLVRDYIPVRKDTVGAIYDRRGVGGMNPDGSPRTDGMYFNRGTGAFVVGPDTSATRGGGYSRQCVKRSHRRSSRPSARFWRAAHLPRTWKEVA